MNLSLTEDFVLSFTEQHRKHHVAGNEGHFSEIFNKVSQGIKGLRAAAETDNKATKALTQ